MLLEIEKIKQAKQLRDNILEAMLLNDFFLGRNYVHKRRDLDIISVYLAICLMEESISAENLENLKKRVFQIKDCLEKVFTDTGEECES